MQMSQCTHLHASKKIGFSKNSIRSKRKAPESGKLDFGQLFDKLGRVFHNNDTTNTKDETLQTAMAAHMQLNQTLKKVMLKNDNMKKLSP